MRGLKAAAVAFLVFQEAAASASGWDVSEHTDAVTQETYYIVTKVADKTVFTRPRSEDLYFPDAKLGFVCDKEGAAAALIYPERIFSPIDQDVQFRFDENRYKSQKWSSLSSGNATSQDDLQKASEILRDTINSKRLIIRSTDRMFGTLLAEFSLAGFSEALSKTSGFCKNHQ